MISSFAIVHMCSVPSSTLPTHLPLTRRLSSTSAIYMRPTIQMIPHLSPRGTKPTTLWASFCTILLPIRPLVAIVWTSRSITWDRRHSVPIALTPATVPRTPLSQLSLIAIWMRYSLQPLSNAILANPKNTLAQAIDLTTWANLGFIHQTATPTKI